mmetsp:Transcript_52/g.248  ORF Transcript_52/g.248 Transcript_52/m.248 type:complete len:257 (-) Transcript_52:1061-1831(-)
MEGEFEFSIYCHTGNWVQATRSSVGNGKVQIVNLVFPMLNLQQFTFVRSLTFKGSLAFIDTSVGDTGTVRSPLCIFGLSCQMYQIVQVGNGHGKIKYTNRFFGTTSTHELFRLLFAFFCQFPELVQAPFCRLFAKCFAGTISKGSQHEIVAPCHTSNSFALVQLPSKPSHIQGLQHFEVARHCRNTRFIVYHKVSDSERHGRCQRIGYGNTVGPTLSQELTGLLFRQRSKLCRSFSCIAGLISSTSRLSRDDGQCT